MRSRWSFVAPTPVTYYRARQVLPGHVVIERDIAAADLGDRENGTRRGWAVVGRTLIADAGTLVCSYVIGATPYVVVDHPYLAGGRHPRFEHRRILLTPQTLAPTRVGQLRPMRVVTDPYTGGACG